MASSFASVRDEQTPASVDRPRPLAPAELAWLAVLPCAALVTLAIVLLGPPLGHALLGPAGDRFWPEVPVRPEPVEHARFLLALLAAPLGAAVVAAGARRPPRLSPRTARVLAGVAQVATVAFLALTLAAQHRLLLDLWRPENPSERIFTLPTLLAALALAAVAGATLGRPALGARLERLTRESGPRRLACLLLAGLLIAIWLSAGFNTERSVGNAEAHHLIPWDMAETFAVLNGRTPLVDFHSQYAQLVPFVAAQPLRVLGASVGTWTATMLVLSGLTLLAVYATFRRLTRRSLLALALFVPFLAGSAFLATGRLSPLEVFSLWPMRYGGPYVLAWLLARHLDAAAPRRRWLLFLAGALVALNNLEFGLPALGGAVAAVACATPPRSWRAASRLVGDTVLGVVAAVALVACLTLAHGGALPRFGLLLEFPRIYGMGGWVLDPMPAVSLHLALYATYVAAVVVAVVRAARDAHGRVLTGLLVWSGIFGLGSGSYYAGRSNVLGLISLLSPWCFALMLLVFVVADGAVRRGRRPGLAQLAVVFGFGLVACAVSQLPRPWGEVARVGRETAPIYEQAAAVRLVASTTAPGEKVAVLIPLGHRVAYDAGVVDVAPYFGAQAMPTAGQLEETFAAMRRERATRLYADAQVTFPALLQAIGDAGYVDRDDGGRYIAFTKPSP